MRHTHPQDGNAKSAPGRYEWPERVIGVVGWCCLTACLIFAGCSKESTRSSDRSRKEKQVKREDLLASVELGEFRIREPRPIENQKIDIQFTAQAIIRQEDQKQVEKFISLYKNTIRDQIILAVRSADSPEFDEPQLEMLRHRMLLRLTGVLGQRLIQDLYVTDYHCQID